MNLQVNLDSFEIKNPFCKRERIHSSGWQDSNLRPPAPKAGAITGLRYTPKASANIELLISKQKLFIFFRSNIISIFVKTKTTLLYMLIIGIAGGTGSGKTTVVQQIINELPETEVGVISQDSYYRENNNLSFEERALINFDHPRAIDFELLVEHLTKLKKGEIIEQPVYSFVTHNRTDDSIITHPRKVMIVEGILILANPELREMFDVKIFVHADSDERLIRRLKRDIAERGRDMEEVLNRYQTTLKPMHQQFIEPTKGFADIIIPNDKYNTVAIDVVRAVINQRIT